LWEDFSWLIVPPIAAWLTVPHFAVIISQTPASTFGWTFFWGVLWGVGGLMYGLGMRYLGISLGNSVLLGFTAAFGALAPSVYYNFYPQEGKVTFTDLLSNSWGQIVLAGVILCLLGIYICGRAGVLKEHELSEEKKKESVKEFNLIKGLIVCIVSGILSSCFNYGIDAGSKMAEVANSAWKAANPGQTGNFLYRNNVTYIVLLWGGLITNFIWTMFLNIRNKTFRNYTDKKTPLLSNYLFCVLAGTLWFLQFFFYGMGESKLGNGASSWILHMAFVILVANMWGFGLKEWKDVSKRTHNTIIFGVITIVLSVILVGYGNAIR
jgi:L-rhamnose-H+ transport protein